MTEKRRGLGRGLGALIPTAPVVEGRPTDVFFPDAGDVSRETSDVSRETSRADLLVGRFPIPDVVSRETSPMDSPVGDRMSTAYANPPSSPAPPGQLASDREVSRETGDVSRETSLTDSPQRTSAESDPTGLRDVPGVHYAEIPLDMIRPNPRQPRTVFDPDELAELVASIQEIGVLQPVVVRRVPMPDADSAVLSGAPSPVQFELIMGERRWRACQEAGLSSVPALIKDTADDDLLRDALLENLHRSQLNPLEEAAAYQQLLDDFGCSHEELAQRIGRSRPQISNTVRLLRLPPLVARRVAAGVLSAGHARALLGLDDGAAMERLAQRIVAEGLSVRSVEEIIAIGGPGEPVAPRKVRSLPERNHRLDDVETRLAERLDTRVRVAMGKRKGKVTVEFATLDDLDRILALVEGR
ncbi:Nucleoid occlusion protein [Austwickia sp. TVS 96-490-7B]|uniref:ParB/RepB/Spo0J family partition protein n=1 Tax=Austwickia sp. TVS 96-490-7B TaxID=2830843 RepID=UPI001C566FD4|nr:ParB/RepB/Spo0J family partition protein [Austwickia sp. TVS 96-490-7B]MBW3084165.1 Nucleoid occlusion protein [Austwickia sp. TVS 96-490-7B]